MANGLAIPVSVSEVSACAAPTIALVPAAPASHVQVSGMLIRAVADVAQQRGVAPEALLGETIGAADADLLETRIPLSEFQLLFERAVRLTGEPALGLHCALQASESSFDLVGALVAHTRTLRNAIQVVRQFHSLVVEDARVHLSERSGTAQLRCEFPRVHGPFDVSFAEFMAAGVVRMLRSFGCARADIRAVCFEHSRPAHHRAYAAAFGGVERFGQSFTGVEFASHVLDRPHLHRHPELQTLLHAQAERSLERLSRPVTFVDRLRAFLRTQPAAQASDMALAARRLGLSVRSLRRRLVEEGASYRELTQSVLQETACSMLRNPDLSVQGIAHTLGFSDSTAFHRAFKRWTGMTPAEYRESA